MCARLVSTLKQALQAWLCMVVFLILGCVCCCSLVLHDGVSWLRKFVFLIGCAWWCSLVAYVGVPNWLCVVVFLGRILQRYCDIFGNM